jgi:alternative ribosome-rescue factor
MSKKNVKSSKESTLVGQADIGRGSIKDNFLAALVTSKMYKLQIVKAKKGKGSFNVKKSIKGKIMGKTLI